MNFLCSVPSLPTLFYDIFSMNWWSLLAAILGTVLVFGLSIYTLWAYASLEERGKAWMCKIAVVLGLTLSCLNVFLLPYDVANRRDLFSIRSLRPGIDTQLLWHILFWTTTIFATLIIPFCSFYYEAWDPEKRNVGKQLKSAFGYTLLISFTSAFLVSLSWTFLGYVDVPYLYYVLDPLGKKSNATSTCTKNLAILQLPASFFVYIVGILNTLGWVLLSVFGGIGLSALPIDFFYSWISRPKTISTENYAHEKDQLTKETLSLQKKGKQLEDTTTVHEEEKNRRKADHFRYEVQKTEEAYEKLEEAYRNRGASLFKALLNLFGGLLCTVFSVAWVLHVILYNLFESHSSLNLVFRWLDAFFPLIGFVLYTFFIFYLMLSVMKGVFRVGFRVPFFAVYPMRVGDTQMNIFLVNILILLLSSVTAIQFCTFSFRDYATNTSVDVLFSTYVSHLRGLGLVPRYMPYFLLLFVAFGIIYPFFVPLRAVSRDK